MTMKLTNHNNHYTLSYHNYHQPAPPASTTTHQGHLHGHTLRKVALDVLKEGVSRGARQPLEPHDQEVCPRLVLHPMLLVDVHGLEERPALDVFLGPLAAREEKARVV